MEARPKKIDPQAVYTVTQACRLLPSNSPNGLHVNTFHRWIHDGIVRAFRVGGRGRWYCHGSELLRVMQADQAAAPPGRSAAEREAAARAALHAMEKMD